MQTINECSASTIILQEQGVTDFRIPELTQLGRKLSRTGDAIFYMDWNSIGEAEDGLPDRPD